MHSKRVPISARISQEDAAFISGLELGGAKTPSDKLRLIIEQARERQIRAQSYQGCLQMMQELLLPIEQKLRQAELDNDLHSELLTRASEWLPDAVAFLVSGGNEGADVLSLEQLMMIEKGLAERVFRLIEAILQLGVTRKSPCYDNTIVAQRVGPALELANVINNVKSGSLT